MHENCVNDLFPQTRTEEFQKKPMAHLQMLMKYAMSPKPTTEPTPSDSKPRKRQRMKGGGGKEKEKEKNGVPGHRPVR